jgi:pimeloyl-ACP methyl ester carboxylesterase
MSTPNPSIGRATLVLMFALLSLVASAPFTFNKVLATSSGRVIIFVPGILGSRIKVDGQSIWGDGIFDSPMMEYSLNQNVTTAPLDAIDVNLLLGTYKRIVYGDFFWSLNGNLASPDTAALFSYDWRAPTALSAEKLAVFICDEAKGRQVILVGHSLGGLVIRHWLQDAYGKACSDGSKIDIAAIVFAATPHLGSPAALAALLREQSLQPGFDWFVADGINQYGYSFDSFYELFPAAHAYRGSTFASPKDSCVAPLGLRA